MMQQTVNQQVGIYRYGARYKSVQSMSVTFSIVIILVGVFFVGIFLHDYFTMALLLFIGLGLLLFSVYKIINFNNGEIAVDKDGIWYLNKGKAAGLNHWAHVRSIDENDTLGFANLYDMSGKLLIRIDHQLGNYRDLIDVVMHHTNLSKLNSGYHAFKKKKIYHVTLLSFFFFIFLLGTVGVMHNVLYGLAVIVISFVYLVFFYLLFPVGVELHADAIEILYPPGIANQIIFFKLIEGIELMKPHSQAAGYQSRIYILIYVRHRAKAIRLSNLDADINVVYAVLHNAVFGENNGLKGSECT